MNLTECIERCVKLDSFENLKLGDYVRYIGFNKLTDEWEYKEGGYFKKWGINIKNIAYIVLYNFSNNRTMILPQYKYLEDNTKIDNLFFFDPTIPNRIPPAPKFKQFNDKSDNNITAADIAILKLNEKVEDLKTEITYLKSKLNKTEKENKVLKMHIKNH